MASNTKNVLQNFNFGGKWIDPSASSEIRARHRSKQNATLGKKISSFFQISRLFSFLSPFKATQTNWSETQEIFEQGFFVQLGVTLTLINV